MTQAPSSGRHVPRASRFRLRARSSAPGSLGKRIAQFHMARPSVANCDAMQRLTSSERRHVPSWPAHGSGVVSHCVASMTMHTGPRAHPLLISGSAFLSRSQTVSDGFRWLPLVSNGFRWFQMVSDGFRWLEKRLRCRLAGGGTPSEHMTDEAKQYAKFCDNLRMRGSNIALVLAALQKHDPRWTRAGIERVVTAWKGAIHGPSG